ncbi:MAG: GNAT family N-acetyltransferase [Thermodesulfobacteriota bacterium]
MNRERRPDGLLYKIATLESEFEQIHRLNYETFVEEIPQHGKNASRRLVDKFHDENTYIICLDGDELAGMLAVRDKRPFSLDRKLPGLDSYLPQSRSLCELRLLSVKKERRYRKVLLGLFVSLAAYCEEKKYDLALISANIAQEKLYTNLGFVPFGPEVGTEGARYQPMYLTPESYYRMKGRTKLLSRMDESRPSSILPLNLLPGPVDVCAGAERAMSEAPVSHRADELTDDLLLVKRMLSGITGAKHAAVLMGSGTLANDALAAQLSLEEGKGLVLSNGEFGERLIDHARRWGLSFNALENGWGECFDREEIEETLALHTDTSWLWAVHSETSTGVLNDARMLGEICAARGVALCLDCISSLGTVPIDLSGVDMATGVSGKGLRSYPGLSFVFYNRAVASRPGRLPRYLDLGLYAESVGTPFTLSSNLLRALKASLGNFSAQERYARILSLSGWLRGRLSDAGLDIVAGKGHESPAIVTIRLPERVSSVALGNKLERSGYYLNWRSDYLLDRNWIQIALMGECSEDSLSPLVDLLRREMMSRRRA